MSEYKGYKGPLPPVYLLASLLMMVALHYQMPGATIFPDPANWVGALLIVIGIAIVIQPALAFRKNETALRPFEVSSALVRSGMYRFTRNPMYLGMLTLLLGAAVLSGSLSPFLMPVMFYLIIRYRFIRVEETMLEEKFGDEYLAFKRSVRRWL